MLWGWDGESARARGVGKKKQQSFRVSLFSPPHTPHTGSLSHSLSLPLVAPNPSQGGMGEPQGRKAGANTLRCVCAPSRKKKGEGVKEGTGKRKRSICVLPPSLPSPISLHPFKGGGRVFCAERAPCFSAQLAAVGDLDGRRRFTRPRPVPLHLLDDVHPFRHRAEDDVLSVQPLRLDGAQEELGACGERKEGRGGGEGGEGKEKRR